MRPRDLFAEARALFIISNCKHCLIYKSFIDRLNRKLPLHKQIKIINCDSYYDFHIPEHPLIKVFEPYIENKFPVLFFDGLEIRSANTKEEIESFLKGLMGHEFINKEENPYLFNKRCEYKRRLFKPQLICEEM